MVHVDDKINKVPPLLQREVIDFVDFLIAPQERKTHKRFSLNWAGGLREFMEKFTSLELQRDSLNGWKKLMRLSEK